MKVAEKPKFVRPVQFNCTGLRLPRLFQLVTFHKVKTMRSLALTTFALISSAILAGCAPEEKKVPDVKPEDKAKLDQQHAAVTDAIKAGKDPGSAYTAPAGAAPTSAGHGR